MKCITLLLDGASDRSYKILNNQTPLAYADTPNLDKLAARSQCGLMTPLAEGLALGTDLAHMLMFGYDLKEYPNRSVIDAIGEGIEMRGDQLYLRASFATVSFEEGYKLKERFTPDFSDDEIKTVLHDLKMTINGYSFTCIHSYDSHCFVVVSGGDLSSCLSDSDPFRKDSYVMAVEPFEAEGVVIETLAMTINQYIKNTYDVLSGHAINKRRMTEGLQPANLLMTKWAGMYHKVEPFQKRNGMTGVVLGQSKLLEGLCEYIGMSYESYESLASGIQSALESDKDYVHLHTKLPDTAAHQKDPLLKARVLEDIDKLLTPLLSFEGLLIVTSDHSTPSSGDSIHSGESVAFMAKGEFIRKDDVAAFDEVACSRGSVQLKASDYMNYIINATDRGSMYHLRQGKSKRHYILNEVNRLL